MNIKKILKKYYASTLLVIFTLTLIWGIGQTLLNSAAFAQSSNPNILKIVQLSDVHIDSKSKDKGGRMLFSSIKLFEDAISQINKMKNVDMVVFSGDNINRPRHYDLVEFMKRANHLKAPWYTALGNHDICVGGYLSKSKYMMLLNSFNLKLHAKKSYYAVTPLHKKNFRVIFLDGVVDNKITSCGHFSKEQLAWLDRELLKCKRKKVLIVQHFPVVEPYSSKSHRVDNADKYLDILDKHKNVVAVLAGHYHCAKIEKRNNVLHIVTPALVQYPNSFRVLTIIKNKSGVKVASEVFETNLSDVQRASKKGVKFAAPLLKGLPGDRDTVFYLSK